LFIPVKTTTTEIKEFKGERDAQTVLYWFTLNPRATSSFPETIGDSTK